MLFAGPKNLNQCAISDPMLPMYSSTLKLAEIVVKTLPARCDFFTRRGGSEHLFCLFFLRRRFLLVYSSHFGVL